LPRGSRFVNSAPNNEPLTLTTSSKTAVEEDRDELNATVTRLCDEIHEAKVDDLTPQTVPLEPPFLSSFKKAKMAAVKKLFSKHVEDLQDKVITLSADLDALSEGNRSFLDALGEAAAEVSEHDQQAWGPTKEGQSLILILLLLSNPNQEIA
jgi:hypothetical protein